LIRIVRAADGELSLDASGHAAGRGAYVCSNVGCLEQAIRRRRLGRALRSEVEPAQLERLKEEFATWAK
jgi:predicted RNA-binding protein YlxR (DUF448 family)